jgi:hypothetical protein
MFVGERCPFQCCDSSYDAHSSIYGNVSRVIFRAYAKICYLVCNGRSLASMAAQFIEQCRERYDRLVGGVYSLAERGGIENTDL